jgi:transcriptional regulator with XRE-family HTH domain
MAERAKPLADEQVAAAEPRAKAYRLSDGRGLFLMVMPGGAKVWRTIYSRDGKRTLHKLGEYPIMSLAQARLARQKVRLSVQKGRNPKRAIAGPERIKTRKITDEALVKIGQRLIWLRVVLGHTQTDFARRLRQSVTQLNKWEKGTSFPNLNALVAICDASGASMDYLLRGIVTVEMPEDLVRPLYQDHAANLRFSTRLREAEDGDNPAAPPLGAYSVGQLIDELQRRGLKSFSFS